MRTTAFFFLTVSFLGSFGSCRIKFISPPDRSEYDRGRLDSEKHRRYVVGDTIQLQWKPGYDEIVVELFQRFNNGEKELSHLLEWFRMGGMLNLL